jgi:hypothetical protein
MIYILTNHPSFPLLLVRDKLFQISTVCGFKTFPLITLTVLLIVSFSFNLVAKTIVTNVPNGKGKGKGKMISEKGKGVTKSKKGKGAITSKKGKGDITSKKGKGDIDSKKGKGAISSKKGKGMMNGKKGKGMMKGGKGMETMASEERTGMKKTEKVKGMSMNGNGKKSKKKEYYVFNNNFKEEQYDIDSSMTDIGYKEMVYTSKQYLGAKSTTGSDQIKTKIRVNIPDSQPDSRNEPKRSVVIPVKKATSKSVLDITQSTEKPTVDFLPRVRNNLFDRRKSIQQLQERLRPLLLGSEDPDA